MLPLGLINFVAIACLQQIQIAFGGSTTPSFFSAILAWIVGIGAWVAVSLASPLLADNRPRRELDVWDIDPQLGTDQGD